MTEAALATRSESCCTESVGFLACATHLAWANPAPGALGTLKEPRKTSYTVENPSIIGDGTLSCTIMLRRRASRLEP